MKVGFIGIGQMGRHMSRHVLEAGFELVVNDINKEAANFLIAKGAQWADSPKAVAQACRIVITSLPTPKHVEAVVYGSNGLQAGWQKGDIYIDMSTNSPTTIRRIAEEAKAMGVAVLDAPVSGGTTGADKGTLAIMVGGDPAALEKSRQVLAAMGPGIFPVGTVGCGNIAKLVNNYISLTTNAVVAEAFVLGVKSGIDPKVLWDICSVSTGKNWSLEQMPGTIFQGNFEPGFKMALGRKDMALALTLGQESGVSLDIGEAVQKEMDIAIADGYSEKSVQAVIIPMESKNGLTVRTPKK
jgi:3-hydroxyisobutyrate dehydrogenase-like beta-hydroxyacid dehydrogenase